MELGNVSIAAVQYAYRRALAVIHSQITGMKASAIKAAPMRISERFPGELSRLHPVRRCYFRLAMRTRRKDEAAKTAHIARREVEHELTQLSLVIRNEITWQSEA